MAQFPIVLSTGAVMRYPFTRVERFSTRSVLFQDFSKQVFSQLSDPLLAFTVDFSLLKDGEIADIIDFYRQMKGHGTSFSFIDPWDNLLLQSEAFENAAWTKSSVTAVTNSTADPFGVASSRVRLITHTLASGSLAQTLAIAPGGSGNSRTDGIEFTFSAYFKTNASAVTFDMIIDDAVVTDSSTKSVTTTGSWVRSEMAFRFPVGNTASNTRVRLTNFSPASSSFFMFGAQLEIGGAAGGYKKTTTKGGLRTKCRFEGDELEHTAQQFGWNNVTLDIREWA